MYDNDTDRPRGMRMPSKGQLPFSFRFRETSWDKRKRPPSGGRFFAVKD